MELLLWGLIIFSCQAVICGAINAVIMARDPRSFFDFLRMIFLPYVLFMLFRNKESLKQDDIF